MLIAAISGIAIVFLTALGVSVLFAVLFAPDHGAAMFVASIGPIIVLLPNGFPAIFIGAFSGLLVSYLSNRKRPND
jgi:hypothetical protein